MTVQFSYVTMTNPEGFVEDDNICRNMVECIFPVSIYVFQVNKGNTRTILEICSKLTIKTLEQCQRSRSGIFVVNFEQISRTLLVFLLLALNK